LCVTFALLGCEPPGLPGLPDLPDLPGLTDPGSTTTDLAAVSSNRALGATMTASWSPASSDRAANANDGNLNTNWSNATNFNSDDWLQVELPEAIRVGKISIVNKVDADAGMHSFDLQYLQNDAWVTLNTYSSTRKGRNRETIEIDIPNITASKWRITNFKLYPGHNCVAVYEFQVNAPIMKTNFAATANPATNVNDGNLQTYWTDEENDFPLGGYVQVELAFPSQTSTIEVVGDILNGFDLQYFDGCNWVHQGRYSTKYLFSYRSPLTIDVNGLVARSWRLTNFTSTDDFPLYANYPVQIHDVKIYGTPLDSELECNGRQLLDDTWKVVAKAPVDECFRGIGQGEYPIQSSCSDGELKTNEAYIWGLTQFEDTLFFGTGANIACLVVDIYSDGSFDPYYRPNDLVCEYSENGQGMKDWRPPSMNMYSELGGLQPLQMPVWAHNMRFDSTGVRAAGTHPSGVVFLGAPNRGDGIYLFAFNGRTGEFLHASELDLGYSSIRKMFAASDGNLYIGLGSAEASLEGGGAVVKWNGDPDAIFSGDLSTLFDFEFVGLRLDGEAAFLTEHDNRLVVSTWPNRNLSFPAVSENRANTAGIWQSPPLPLTSASTGNWHKIWSAGEYEPDPLVASLYGGGTVKSFDGWLYWGTMHVPGFSYLKYTRNWGDPSRDRDKSRLIHSTWRETSIFRARNLGTSRQEIQLLYGGSALFDDIRPGHYPVIDGYGRWSIDIDSEMNKMGLTPLYGRGGFGNEWNNYCWTMAIYDNHLYVGTMDYSWIVMEDEEDVRDNEYYRKSVYGSDLWRFESSSIPAMPVSIDGMQNGLNYGVRSVVADDRYLYIGTGNQANLSEAGGWELIKLTTKSDGIDDPALIPAFSGYAYDLRYPQFNRTSNDDSSYIYDLDLFD
jgi:hypothetical protein